MMILKGIFKLILFVVVAANKVDSFVVTQPRRVVKTTVVFRTNTLFYQKNDTNAININDARRRFERTATNAKHTDDGPCILTIDNIQYNVTAWAKAHPGGVAILKKFHNKDATKAFHAAHHSAQAIEMLKDFAITATELNNITDINTNTVATSASAITEDSVFTTTATTTTTTTKTNKTIPRWRVKLFTKEDPIGIHKYLGVFVLLHFIFRFYQMYFADNSAGLGTRLGRGPSWIPVLCLIPHGLLSASSLIFHTVPRDRVVGKPMIWKEYRIHNIGFGIRSIICAALASISIHGGNTRILRKIAVWGSVLSCLGAIINADIATKYLRSNNLESTTATMPYWDGCSIKTQKRFKSFYAYCQFLATIACLAVTNPAWPLSVLLAIQLASLLMTLVRKGLLSTKGYHYGYTATLIAPYIVAFRSMYITKTPEVLYIFTLGTILYQLRRRGINKYALWLPVMTWRILYGDTFLPYNVW